MCSENCKVHPDRESVGDATVTVDYDDGTEDEFQIDMCEECADYMWEVNFNPEIMVDHFNIGENDE